MDYYIVMFNDEYLDLNILAGPLDEKEALVTLKQETAKRLCQLFDCSPEEAAEIVEKTYATKYGEYCDEKMDFEISGYQARITYGDGYEDRIQIVQYDAGGSR